MYDGVLVLDISMKNWPHSEMRLSLKKRQQLLAYSSPTPHHANALPLGSVAPLPALAARRRNATHAIARGRRWGIVPEVGSRELQHPSLEQQHCGPAAVCKKRFLEVNRVVVRKL